MTLFQKLLVANRGEIACRVISSAQAKGYRTVAVYSDADIGARHTKMADEAVRLGPSAVGQSYLDIERVIAAAHRSGADAVHPGYGFLSEKAAFAKACHDAGLIFVGPSAEAIQMMGDKAEAKRRMITAGVPCVPGYQGDDQDDQTLTNEALQIGFPVMVKAAAGGGGRGMRLVQSVDELSAALRSARSEASNAFGDDRLLLERAIIGPRHIEIQVFGDTHGNIVHLGERDCSIQRRHQKVVEESPSPAVDALLRARMGDAAVQAARSINYVGAGTIEFLLDRGGDFFFLEMNTRLQVEHPVTELVTGIDLVALQLDVAQGKPLPFEQQDIRLSGHAIEVRLYAEDPEQQFLPQTGVIQYWQPPVGDGVRTDHGVETGSEVSMFYDPMIAKVITYGSNREEARRRLVRAIGDTTILGLTTNKTFLKQVLEKRRFIDGQATTAFIDMEFPDGVVGSPPSVSALSLASLIFADQCGEGWQSSRWVEHSLIFKHAGTEHRVFVRRSGDYWCIRTSDGWSSNLRILDRQQNHLRYEDDGRIRSAAFSRSGDFLYVDDGDQPLIFEDYTFKVAAASGSHSGGALIAPMNGMITALNVAVGDRVQRGQLIAVLEAMKMEHQIVAPADGVVREVGAAVGAQIANRAVIVMIDTELAA